MVFGTGVIVRDGHGGILLGKRADHQGWCGGGGHIEIGETPYEAARRELQEEFGILAIGMEEIGKIRGVTPDGESYQSWIFVADNFVGVPMGDKDEIKHATWVSEDVIRGGGMRLFPPFEKSYRLYDRKRPEFDPKVTEVIEVEEGKEPLGSYQHTEE